MQEVRWNRFVAPESQGDGREVRRYSKGKAKKAKPWKLDTSIWAPRRVWADARAFLDTDDSLRKALRRDWGRAVEERGLGRYIAKRDDDGDEDADGDGISDEVEEVFETLAARGYIAYQLFDYYAAQGIAQSVFHIQQNGWIDFCKDCSPARSVAAPILRHGAGAARDGCAEAGCCKPYVVNRICSKRIADPPP